MNRHLFAFIITTLLYTTLLGTFLYTYEESKTIQTKSQQSNEKVKFTILSQNDETSKVKSKPTPKPITEIKKEVTKKIIKKEIIKTKTKPKPVVKEIEKPKKQEIKKIVEKQKEIPTVTKQQIKQNNSETKKTVIIDDSKEKSIKQNQYYTQIKQAISSNKTYPKIAIRRGIEGEVKIKFTISANGELIKFEIIDGKKVFKNSIEEAIQKSFPLTPPKGLFLSNLDLSLTIQYKLY